MCCQMITGFCEGRKAAVFPFAMISQTRVIRFVMRLTEPYNPARLVSCRTGICAGRQGLHVCRLGGQQLAVTILGHFTTVRVAPSGANGRESLVKANRPVNLDLGTIKLPITAYASILHRVSGVFVAAGVAVLLYLFDLSLSSPEGFDQVGEMLGSPLAKLVLWAVTAGLIYHSVAGLKHLVMDLGIGETLEGGILGAKLVFVVSAILIALAGVWIW